MRYKGHLAYPCPWKPSTKHSEVSYQGGVCLTKDDQGLLTKVSGTFSSCSLCVKDHQLLATLLHIPAGETDPSRLSCCFFWCGRTATCAYKCMCEFER